MLTFVIGLSCPKAYHRHDHSKGIVEYHRLYSECCASIEALGIVLKASCLRASRGFSSRRLSSRRSASVFQHRVLCPEAHLRFNRNLVSASGR
jgi:hypothetical protein